MVNIVSVIWLAVALHFHVLSSASSSVNQWASFCLIDDLHLVIYPFMFVVRGRISCSMNCPFMNICISIYYPMSRPCILTYV